MLIQELVPSEQTAYPGVVEKNIKTYQFYPVILTNNVWKAV